MPDRNQESPSWVRFWGIGFNFVGAVVVGAVLGFVADRYLRWTPWGLVCGAMLGVAAGMYNLIRESMAAFQDQAKEDAERKREKQG